MPVAIVGPTASGKTMRAVEVARAFQGEIVSCDSRQVYAGMTIGTGKDLEEYEEIPYYMVDICEAGEKYNLHRFLRDFDSACKDIEKRGRRVVACGGSGMYIESALSGIKLPEVPENKELREYLSNKSLEELTAILSSMKTLHNSTDVDSCKRAIRAIEIEEYYRRNPQAAVDSRKAEAVKMPALIIGIDIDREARRRRISERLKTRMEQGMLQEVEALLEKGISPEDLIYYGLEYKFLTLHLIGKMSREEMLCGLEIAIHQFAKRQMTWFRGMERRGFNIHWLPYDMPKDDFISEVGRLLEKN